MFCLRAIFEEVNLLTRNARRRFVVVLYILVEGEEGEASDGALLQLLYVFGAEVAQQLAELGVLHVFVVLDGNAQDVYRLNVHHLNTYNVFTTPNTSPTPGNLQGEV